MPLPSYHRLRLIVALALALANSSYAQITVTAALEVPTTSYLATDTVTMAGGTLTFASAEKSNLFTFGGLAAAQTGTGYNISLQNTASAAIGLKVGDNNASTIYAGVLSGAGSLTKAGTGTLTLTGANTYTGGTFINSGGTLQVGNMGTTGSIDGNVDNGATLTFARSDNITFGSNISGTGQVVQKGGGQLSLKGANTYTGGTISNAGDILIAASNALAASGSVYINANTSAAPAGLILAAGFAQTIGALTYGGADAITTQNNSISLNTGSTLTLGGTVTYLATNNPIEAYVNGAGTLALGGNRIFAIGNSTGTNSELNIAAPITGAGYSLTKTGAGRLYLTGANTYSGGTIINGGELFTGASSNNVLPSGGNVTVNTTIPGDIGKFIIGAGATQTIGTLTFGGSTATATSTNYVVLNSAGSTLTLGGTVTYLATNNPYGAQISGAGALALGGNRIFDIGNSTGTNSELNIEAPITGAGYSLTKTGAGRLYLTGANTYSGGTIINGGELFTGASTNNVLPSGGNVTVNTTTPGGYGDFIVGAGATQTIGTLTFGGSNATSTSTNRVFLNGADSTLTLGGDVTYDATNNPLLAGIYGTTGTLNLGGNRVFNIGDSSSASTAELVINSALAGSGYSLTKTGAGWLALEGTNTYTGGTTISAGTLELYNSTVLGNVVNNASLVVNNSVDGTYAGIISGTGAVIKGINTGILTLTGNNTFSGGLTLNGPVSVSSDSNLGATSGSLTFNNEVLLTTANMTLASTRSVVLASGSTNGGFSPNYGTTLTYGGVISGSGGLYKWNSGTLTLTGASTYTGGTTIGYGKLLVTNSTGSATGSGAVVVNDGTTFGGTGLISGALIINGGGSVSPGASPGQLQVGGGTTFASGGRYVFEINNTVGAPGTNWDLLSISGGLTISATVNTPFVLDLVSLTADNAKGMLANFNSANDYSWKFVTTTTGITGFSAGAFKYNVSNFANSLDVGHFFVSQTGNDLYLNFTPVPEPTTWVLLSLGLSSVLLSLRRKSRARLVE